LADFWGPLLGAGVGGSIGFLSNFALARRAELSAVRQDLYYVKVHRIYDRVWQLVDATREGAVLSREDAREIEAGLRDVEMAAVRDDRRSYRAAARLRAMGKELAAVSSAADRRGQLRSIGDELAAYNDALGKKLGSVRHRVAFFFQRR
jgi:hypothetical protein